MKKAELQSGDLQNEVDDLTANIHDLEDQRQASIPNVQDIIHKLKDKSEKLYWKIQTLEFKCTSLESERETFRKLEAEIDACKVMLQILRENANNWNRIIVQPR